MSKNLVAFIDMGHGGHDPGATGHNMKEKDIVLEIGLEAGKDVERHGVKVVYSRTTDIFVTLSDRAKMANDANADSFTSLHVNAATNPQANGIETFSHPTSIRGFELSKNIQSQIVKDGIFKSDRGNKKANFAVLRLTKMPAALVELGFISNYQDSILIKTKKSELAKSVAKGILKDLGIKYIDKLEEKIESNKLYKVQVGAYSVKENAEKMLEDLKNSGFNGYIKQEDITVKEDIVKKKSKYYKIGDAQIIETTPDNIYIDVIGDTLHNKKVFGVNGVLYDTNTAPVTSPNSCVFIAMNKGKAISDNAQFNGYKGPPRATLIYHTNNLLGFRQLTNINPIRDIAKLAIGGYMVKPYMDFKNERIPGSVNYKTAHTYIGYDKEAKVYLIVKPNHMIRNIVPLMDELKITHCIVLDGGGSSQLNHPEGNYRSSRKINTAILLKEI